jgi:hypothetical protein
MAKGRYVSFGEQVGAVSSLTLALSVVPVTLRNSIWNRTAPLFLAHHGNPPRVNATGLWLKMAWDKGWDADEYRAESFSLCALVIKDWLLKVAEWHEVYEFAQSFPQWAQFDTRDRKEWEGQINDALFQERSPYRFVDHQLTPIASEEERAAVEDAATLKGRYAPAAEHLGKALAKFSDRPEPDYENAVKEAASAVESALKIATGRDSVGDAARAFREAHGVHAALSESASKLFGYVATDMACVMERPTKESPWNSTSQSW